MGDVLGLCRGGNRSAQLSWKVGVPAAASSAEQWGLIYPNLHHFLETAPRAGGHRHHNLMDRAMMRCLKTLPSLGRLLCKGDLSCRSSESSGFSMMQLC